MRRKNMSKYLEPNHDVSKVLVGDPMARQYQGFYKPVPNARGASFSAKVFGVSAGIDTILNMQAGDDFGTAAVKGVAAGMLWTTFPAIMAAVTLAPALSAGYAAAHNWYREKQAWYNKQHLPSFGGNYQDTRRALTMRQAAVEAIQGSKLNARSALGGEAKLLAHSLYRG